MPSKHPFIMLIKVNMPTLVGIVTFVSMINTPIESLKARHFSALYSINHLSLASFLWDICNSADSDQTPPNAGSDQDLHCLLYSMFY